MDEAIELLSDLREELGADAAFAVDDLRRILAFDAAVTSETNSLAEVGAGLISCAAETLGLINQVTAGRRASQGFTVTLPSGPVLYVGPVALGVALVVVWPKHLSDARHTAPATVSRRLRHTRARLAAALARSSE